MTSKILYFIAFLHLAISSTALAGLTAYDGFDYGNSGGNLTAKNGGSGWSGAYTNSGNSTVYTTSGLTYTGLPTTGGASSAYDGGTSTTINFRNFGTTYGDDETETWISFLVQRRGSASTAAFAGLSFYNSGGVAAANSEVSFANGGTGGAWRIFDTGTPAVSASTATVPASNTTYLLVARILWGKGASGKDAVSLFVNPALGSIPAAADASLDVDMTNFNKIRIAGQNAVNYTFDEIRVGSSFLVVVGQSEVPVVPIPLPPPDTIPLSITQKGSSYEFSWPSQKGKVYDLLSSTNLTSSPASWAAYAPYSNIIPTVPANILTGVTPSGSARFFVVAEKPAVAGFSVLVQNFGVSGNTSTEGLARLSTVQATNPNHLVLYFGINDALNSAKLVSLTTYRQNLTNMVNQAVTAGVRKVFLVGIHPVNAAYVAARHPTHPQILRLQDYLAEYNAAVAAVATATGATFIDWRARFLAVSPGPTIEEATADHVNSLLRCPLTTNPDDADGVHLTIDGNQFLGMRVAQALSSVVVSGDKIACMGDSVTYGYAMTGAGTTTGNTYPATVSTTLNP